MDNCTFSSINKSWWILIPRRRFVTPSHWVKRRLRYFHSHRICPYVGPFGYVDTTAYKPTMACPFQLDQCQKLFKRFQSQGGDHDPKIKIKQREKLGEAVEHYVSYKSVRKMEHIIYAIIIICILYMHFFYICR